MNINKSIQLAIEHHQAGNLQQAEHIYKRILKVQPDNADALHFLGIIYYQLRNYDLAIEYLKKVLQFNPANADAHYNLGIAFQEKGQIDEAIRCFQKTTELDPNFAMAYCNLGVALQEEKGQLDEAITYYQKALQLSPNLVYAHYNLGNALQDKGQLDEAISSFQKAIELNPNYAMAYYNLGNALREKGQRDEAITCLQKAIELDPNYAATHNNLGIAFKEKGQLDVAITCFQKAIQFDSDYAMAYCNLGSALKEKGEFDEAITYYQRSLQLSPDLVDAHFNMSLIFLLLGNFEEGWKEYEWRWKLKDFYRRSFSQPSWDGYDIKGLTILLYAEQGLGDTIQFIRYVPLVAQQGAKVAVECQRGLTSLLKNVAGIQEIIAHGEKLSEFDIHCSLLTLPLVFDTTLEDIPAQVPYIKADSILVQKWHEKIILDNSKFKIGLVWAGDPRLKDDRTRSCSLEIFSPLAQINGITFYSLQKGETANQAKNPPEGMKLIDYTEEIKDFSDTAALIENLDLVISVDTAVVHLAGALGKPVWTLLPFVPDWRWLLKREDSPWYPTMRLFRQPSRGDWNTVIANVLNKLQKELIKD